MTVTRLRSPKPLLRFGALVTGFALVVSACSDPSASSSGGSGSSDADSTITAGYTAPVTTIDPGAACDPPSYTAVQQLYDELVTGTGKEPVQPMLASSWTQNDDATSYTFKLREDVTFSSGNPMTSADVVYSLNYALERDGCAAYVMTSGYSEIDTITAPDDYTVTVTFTSPNPIFLSTLSGQVAILDSKVVEEHGGSSDEGAAWLATNAAGSGPFTLETYQPDSQVVFNARSDYWGGAPAPSKVIMKIVPDASSLAVLAKSGELDLAYNVPLSNVDSLKSDPNLQIITNPSMRYYNVGFNVSKAPLDNELVRQALTYATPLDEIVKNFGYGMAQKLTSPLLPAQTYYEETPDLYPYNIEKAKQLLAEAGEPNPQLTLTLQSGYPVLKQLATVLQSSWAEAGADLQINVVSPAQFVDEVYGWKDQMYMITDGPQGTYDPGYFFGFFLKCDNAFNWSRYCNKQVDQLLAEAQATTDPNVAGPLYRQIAQIAAKEAPYLMLMNPNSTIVAKKSVSGYVQYSDDVTRFNTITATSTK
ncbi:ABC transporter substrate-binding protein [soil metagenome]